MTMIPKAQVIRALTKRRKTVFLMFCDGKFTHTTIRGNVDNHTLVGTYSWREPALSAVEINEDMHYVLDQWRKER